MNKKELILQTACSLFAKRGYSGISMAELAKLTGVAQGTIFYHFNKKETLFLSILKRFQEELVEAFGSHEQKSSVNNGLEALLKNIEFYFDVFGEMEDQFLLLHRHDAYEIASQNRECLKLLKDIYSNIVGFFENAIAKGQKDGSIAKHSSRKTAMIIFAMVDGLVRLNTCGIYEVDALYDDFISFIHKMMSHQGPSNTQAYRSTMDEKDKFRPVKQSG